MDKKSILILTFISLFFCLSAAAEILVQKDKTEDLSYTDAYVKALYLIKIREFISWPEGQNIQKICVMGNDLTGSSLAQITREMPAYKSLKIEKKMLTSDFNDCHILYIAQASEGIVGQVLFSVQSLPILTVSDITNFVVRGGMIGFAQENQQVKLEVNLTPAHESRIEISSKLLQISKRVIKKPQTILENKPLRGSLKNR